METPKDEGVTSVKKGASMLSKKRFQQINTMLHDVIQDQELVERVLTSIKEIMQFDPDVSQYRGYTKDRGDATKAYRQRKKELGMTTYVTSGRKKMYHSSKEVVHTTKSI